MAEQKESRAVSGEDRPEPSFTLLTFRQKFCADVVIVGRILHRCWVVFGERTHKKVQE
jgi:hypothetical protein